MQGATDGLTPVTKCQICDMGQGETVKNVMLECESTGDRNEMIQVVQRQLGMSEWRRHEGNQWYYCLDYVKK